MCMKEGPLAGGYLKAIGGKQDGDGYRESMSGDKDSAALWKRLAMASRMGLRGRGTVLAHGRPLAGCFVVRVVHIGLASREKALSVKRCWLRRGLTVRRPAELVGIGSGDLGAGWLGWGALVSRSGLVWSEP